MHAIRHNLRAVRLLADVPVWAVVGTVVLLGAGVRADPPCNRPPIPLFSLDANSPQVTDGTFEAADILRKDGQGNQPPVEEVDGAAIGLGNASDDLDALSFANDSHEPLSEFVVLFSVDRGTVGSAPPENLLKQRAVRYNVSDQDTKGQHAGDQFMSLTSTNFETPAPGAARFAANNALSINNFDQGGTSFSVFPQTSADDTSADAQDNVDATGLSVDGLRAVLAPIYFSATSNSPSANQMASDLGFSGSGANIFYEPTPSNGVANVSMFAGFVALGLASGDDIDAMMVFDWNADGEFNDGNGTTLPDVVLFSLTPGSPSLGDGTVVGASATGAAADVIYVEYNAGSPTVLVAATLLGVGTATDNANALELFLCADPFECARTRGARDVLGDWNDDGAIDGNDVPYFQACFDSDAPYQVGFVEECDPGVFQCNCHLGDFNCDLFVDCADWSEFRARFQGGSLAPFAPCTVPAASGWGLAVLVLLIMVAAAIVLKRRSPAL